MSWGLLKIELEGSHVCFAYTENIKMLTFPSGFFFLWITPFKKAVKISSSQVVFAVQGFSERALFAFINKKMGRDKQEIFVCVYF